jgi:hypothetical protein
MLLAMLLIVVVMEGCAAQRFNLRRVKEARSINELIDILGYLECKQADIYRECLYQSESFNIFSLESRTQVFRFLIDSNGQIINTNLSETSIRYHLFPRFRLPAGFEEFK